MFVTFSTFVRIIVKITQIMKAQKCRLVVHGQFKQHDLGKFDSISKAKTYAKECVDRPYTIIKIKM